LASRITAPTPSRLAIADAKNHWLNFRSAKISLMDLMEQLNTKSLANLRVMAYWLQRNLLEMGSQGYFNHWTDLDWKVGLGSFSTSTGCPWMMTTRRRSLRA
jgi:hypothetical protein